MAGHGRRYGRAELEALIASKQASLVRAAAKILQDAAEAEDVVQETLAATWQRAETISPRKVKAYVFRAVQFNSLKRRARRRRHVSLDALPQPPAAEDDRQQPDTRMDAMELERAVAGLPESQQAVLRMKYYLGLTFREIGKALSVSQNTAASRCRYALRTLRKMLTRPAEDQRANEGDWR